MVEAPTTTQAPGLRVARGGRARTVLACAVLLLGALGLGGCAAARNELGTASSGCYVDLALATHAVHHEGRLAGVRLVSVASLRAHAPVLFKAAEVRGKRLGQVCLVAFSGSFHASLVERPVGETAGRLAVVELGYPHRTLLVTLLVKHPPVPFGHYHL